MKKVKIFGESAAGIPAYQTNGAAGVDLQSNSLSPIMIKAKDRCIVGTGLFMEIPEGYEGQIRPRSGLVLKHGITVLNSPGTVDCDYRGEIRIILYNASDVNFYVNKGDRIAQMVFAKVEKMGFVEVASLDKLKGTERASGGFGSTGR